MEPESLAPQVSPAHMRRMALRVREHVLTMSGAGGCFVGAALSCVDLLVYLYARELRVNPNKPEDIGRDHFLLSKGHAVPALYGTLVEAGFLEASRLKHHLDGSEGVYWHPNPELPGVEFHSGSLGHLLSVGVGMAYDIRLRGGRNRAFVLLGDGELNEGSVWEALMVAAALRLDNLIAIVDRNGLQANVATEALVPLEPLADKFAAFGWGVREVDGHCFNALSSAFTELPLVLDRPSVLVAKTVRGRGVPSLQHRPDAWFLKPSAEQVHELLAELARTHELESTHV